MKRWRPRIVRIPNRAPSSPERTMDACVPMASTAQCRRPPRSSATAGRCSCSVSCCSVRWDSTRSPVAYPASPGRSWPRTPAPHRPRRHRARRPTRHRDAGVLAHVRRRAARRVGQVAGCVGGRLGHGRPIASRARSRPARAVDQPSHRRRCAAHPAGGRGLRPSRTPLVPLMARPRKAGGRFDLSRGSPARPARLHLRAG